MANDRIPSLSIGLPVYNGGDLLKIALESLLAQEYTDYELVISDNASTDGTEELCRSYAARDKRIRFFRRDKNYGMADNGLFVVSQARAPLYMPASHDDQWLPPYISRCIEPFATNPNVVLVAPGIQFLGLDLLVIDWPYPPLHTVGLDIRSRVAQIFSECGVGYNSYGIYRTNAIRQVCVTEGCYGGDVIMLLRLMFLGEVQHIPEILLRFRINFRSSEDQVEAISPEVAKKKPTRNYTIMTINLLRAIMKAPIDDLLKRVLISDAIGIIALKNHDWRASILKENPNLLPFIQPEKNGCVPSVEANLISVFSAFLLSHCFASNDFEGSIEFRDELDLSLLSSTYKPPVPGHKEFIETVGNLIEKKRAYDALKYFDTYVGSVPRTEYIDRLDQIMNRIRQG